MTHSSWRQDLVTALAKNGETLDQIEVSVPPLDAPEMNHAFNHGYGIPEGCSFTVWTASRVYFPVCYDGAEWVGSVARNPDGQASSHHGAG